MRFPRTQGCCITDPTKTKSESNGGLQEPTRILKSSYDADVPTSQPFVVDPVTSSPAGRLLAFSSSLPDPMGLQGTQTLVRATPSPPRVRPQPSSSTVPLPAPVGGITAPLATNALPLAPGAALTRQETDVIPETPQSDQDPQQAHRRTPTAALPLAHPVVDQESFVIPEPQAETHQVPGPRKRSAPDDFEGPPTPTKKMRRPYSGNQKSAGVKPMATRVGAMRGRQEATSPANARPSSRKPSTRISSPSKAIVTPHTSMWDETLDDGFGRKAAETAARAKKPTQLPV